MARKNNNGYRLPMPTVGGADFDFIMRDPLDDYFDQCERRHMRRSTAVRGLAVA